MKKHWKVGLGFGVCFVMIVSVIFGFIKYNPLKMVKQNDEKKAAAVALTNFDGKEISYNTDYDYIVVEIVPDISYAQLGYLMEGQEPIDVMKACADGKADDLVSMLPDGTYKEVDTINNSQYEDLKDIYGESAMKEYWEVASGTAVGVRKTQYALKTGQKFVINQNLLTKKFSAAMEEKNVEDLTLITLTSSQLNAAELGGTDSNDKRLNTVTNLMKNADVVIFNQTYLKGSVNQTAFTQYMNNATEGNNFAKADLDFSVVQTIFKQVGNKKNPTPILLDSSIYDVVDASNETITTYQYRLSRENKYENNKIKNDFTVYGSGGLFNITNHKAGLDVKASDNNTYKLFLMSVFRDPAEFYNLFVESGLITSDGSNDLQKEKVSSDRLKYWNIYSFLPSKGDLASEASKTGDDRFAEADFDYWTKQMAILLEYNNKNYRNCNVLTFDAGTSLVDRLDSTSSYSVMNAKNTSNPNSEDKTLAQEIVSVMKYEPKSFETGKKYKVLEIEPALPAKDSENYLKAASLERMLPYTSYSKKNTFSVEVIRMTTAEFKAKVEDLVSVYDLIYIGDDTSGMYTNSDGTVHYGVKNVANTSGDNKAIEGAIYAHVGGLVPFRFVDSDGFGYASNAYSFGDKDENYANSYGEKNANGYAFYAKRSYMTQDTTDPRAKYGQLRYSGNDITAKKREELISFVNKANLPVMVAGRLYEDVSNNHGKSLSDRKYKYFFDNFKDGETINNMLEFLDSEIANVVDMDFNYRTAASDDAEKVLSRLTVNKPKLEVISATYDNREKGKQTYSLTENMEYDFSSTSSKHNITFSYHITDDEQPNSSYRIAFYVDKNADGIFSNDEKLTTKNTVSGENRSITLQINTRYTGALTWKMVASPTRNEYLFSSQVGYGTIRFGNVGTKKLVKVLQVYSTGKHTTNWGYEKQDQVNLKDSTWSALFNSLQDYEINITRMELEDFRYNLSSDALNGYDMVIFGFADSYRDIDLMYSASTAKKIEDYIKAGKSVLFTHDLTSQLNNYDVISENASQYMETTNGAFFNRYLRDAMGLNRFGLALTTDKIASACSNYDKTSTWENMGFTYTALMQYSNYRRGQNDTSLTEKKGYQGPYKGLYANFYSGNPGWPDISAHLDSGKEDEYATQYVTNVNNGQITKYPFDLSQETSNIVTHKNRQGVEEKRYKIARTHGQYYTLNLEDKDTICWYALSDGVNSNGTWSSNGWYSTSPNDAENNYYIYNKGNVTYSGVGHSKTADMSTFERKLFVNTMIAALRAGIEGPEAVITNGDNIPDGDEDRYVVMADVDVDSDDSEFAQTEDVKFYVTDDSAKAGDHLYVTLEVYDNTQKSWIDVTTATKSDGSYQYKVLDSSGKEIGNSDRHRFIYKYQDTDGSAKQKEIQVLSLNRSLSSISADKVYTYTIKYPREILKTQNLQDFRITVYNSESATSYTRGAVMRQSLFPLD